MCHPHDWCLTDGIKLLHCTALSKLHKKAEAHKRKTKRKYDFTWGPPTIAWSHPRTVTQFSGLCIHLLSLSLQSLTWWKNSPSNPWENLRWPQLPQTSPKRPRFILHLEENLTAQQLQLLRFSRFSATWLVWVVTSESLPEEDAISSPPQAPPHPGLPALTSTVLWAAGGAGCHNTPCRMPDCTAAQPPEGWSILQDGLWHHLFFPPLPRRIWITLMVTEPTGNKRPSQVSNSFKLCFGSPPAAAASQHFLLEPRTSVQQVMTWPY